MDILYKTWELPIEHGSGLVSPSCQVCLAVPPALSLIVKSSDCIPIPIIFWCDLCLKAHPIV